MSASSGGVPRIPGYAIEGELGRGASGVVYRARQLSVDRPVALKVLHAGRVQGSRGIRRLQREARIAAQLSHPGLISAIDMGESGGHWWMAMELVEGPSLAQRLASGGRLEESEALALFLPLCDALQHASERGVVHRDIKPANILLERPDHPRLVDLGLARVADDPALTLTGATLGTPHYISPEQARDPGLVDIRSDLWSLGATLFHAVCGRPPFEGDSSAEILSAVLYGPIPDPRALRPELSSGLALVLRKCLSRDPDRRYFTPAELAADLALVRDHRPPRVRRSDLEPLDPARVARRWPLVAALGVLAALVVALVVLRPPGDAPPAPVPTERAPASWPPLERLAARVEAGEASLARLALDLEELRPGLPDGARARHEALRLRLREELGEALDGLWSEVVAEVEQRLAEHDFAAAASSVGDDLLRRLREATGHAPGDLPRPADRATFARRRDELAGRVAAAREAALARVATDLEVHLRRRVLPEAEAARRAGSWAVARAALATPLERLLADAGCDARGLGEDELALRLAGISEELARRRLALEEGWAALDGELVAGARERAVRARARVEAGELDGAVEELEAGFDEALARRGLDRAELVRAPGGEALAVQAALTLELADRVEALRAAAAEALLAGHDAAAAPLLARRDYGALRTHHESLRGDPRLAVLEDALAVRIEEAIELEAFLRRAARGVERLVGREVTLRQGAIQVRGTVVSRGAPLVDGFRLRLSDSSARDYLLRPSKGGEGEVLAPAGLERLALEGADLAADPGLRLQVALFRFHEGDPEGAAEALEGAGGGSLLAHDLGLRVAAALGREQELLDRRRERALAEAAALSGPGADALPREERSARIARLLRESRDVLPDDLEHSLVAIRARLERRLPPSTPDDFLRRFAPDACAFPQFGRVRLEFSFARAAVGTWRTGDWVFAGGEGWSAPAQPTLEALVASRGPALDLVDPLEAAGGALDLELTLHQPQDAPPDLLVVSALGFQVAVAGPRGAEPPRVLADTEGLASVVARVRAGEGASFSGLARGEDHRLFLRLVPGSGRVVVRVDGVEVESRLCPAPSPGSAPVLELRAVEPVELRAVALEANRR